MRSTSAARESSCPNSQMTESTSAQGPSPMIWATAAQLRLNTAHIARQLLVLFVMMPQQYPSTGVGNESGSSRNRMPVRKSDGAGLLVLVLF